MKKKKLEKKEMPFLDHLEELRWRILKTLASIIILTCATFPMTTWILKILTYPNTHLPNPAKLVFLKPTAMMMIRMEVSIAVGFIGSLPVIVFQLWRFVAPGLLPKERNYVFPVILITLFCFILGALFAYYVIIPVMLPFLFSMGTDFIEATININDYMSFILRLILISGLIFELPVLAFFLARLGLLTPAFLRKSRRYSIVFMFIFAAIVTPTPDPFNQIIMVVPLLLLYEISIWVSAIGSRKRNEADDLPVKKSKRDVSKKRKKSSGKK